MMYLFTNQPNGSEKWEISGRGSWLDRMKDSGLNVPRMPLKQKGGMGQRREKVSVFSEEHVERGIRRVLC